MLIFTAIIGGGILLYVDRRERKEDVAAMETRMDEKAAAMEKRMDEKAAAMKAEMDFKYSFTTLISFTAALASIIPYFKGL